MRVFVTGASGFVGSRVISFLEKDEVLCLVLDDQDAKKVPGVHHVRGELGRPDLWKAEVERFAPDCCVHLAWEGLPDYSLSRCRANLDSSLRLIEAVADAGVRRIVVAGTCWEYGNASGAVKEDTASNGYGVFAATKHALHTVLESFARDCGLEHRWGRIFFAYGPGQRAASLIPHCHEAFSRGAEPQIRNPGSVQDFVYIDDVARGLVAISRADAGSGVFNIGGGTPAAVAEVVNLIAEHFNVAQPYPTFSHGSGFWADTGKTREATGWNAETSLEDGIRLTLRELDGNS